MGKFTPGPWRVEVAGTRGLYRVLIPTEHELAAAETDGMDGGSVTSANAALIAAAPELYEALRLIVGMHANFSDKPEWVAARSALLKATPQKNEEVR